MSEPASLRTARASCNRALRQLADLKELATDEPTLRLRAPSISDWSIGEQVEHLRRSDLTILKALDSLDTDATRDGSPNLIGRVVLLTGFIPRGRGRAPGATAPIDVDMTHLGANLEAVERGFTELVPDLERLSQSSATIKHPALGHFTASQMLAFAGIHHHHHMKIIRDIRRENPS